MFRPSLASQVKELMLPSVDRVNGARRTVLQSAAASGSNGAFGAVLAGMKAYASVEEVRHHGRSSFVSIVQMARAVAAAGGV